MSPPASERKHEPHPAPEQRLHQFPARVTEGSLPLVQLIVAAGLVPRVRLDEAVVLAALEACCGIALTLDGDGESAASLPSRIESAAEAQAADLPEGWKTVVALHLVSSWAEEGTTLPAETLDAAALLFAEINGRFDSNEL